MFYVCGLRRFRGFSQAHILESLRDVNNVFSRNRLPLHCERVLLISFSSKQDLSAHDSFKVLTRFEQEQDGFPRKQMHSYQQNNIDATKRVFSEGMRHNDHPFEDASAVEDNSSAESKVEGMDDVPYGLDHVHKKKLKRVRTSPQYPLINMGNESKTFTPNFEKSKKLLESLNLPTFELPHYPDIQVMSEEELHQCMSRLREIGIHVVFSLFLIQRIAAEIELEQTAKRAAPLSQTKNWFKLRNGKYRVTSLQAVSLYLKLCKLLENPELDLYEFISDLSSVSINEPLNTVVSKIQLLRSVGATPQDIVSNLTLLKGCNIFKTKIQLYKNLFLHTKPSFPVNLFLSTTMTEFRQKLQVGQDINVIAHLLGVTPNDFLMCWGFKSISPTSLMHKIHLLLRAGLAKQDLFNNISMVNRLSLNKIQPRLELLLKSGHAISLYELKALEDGNDLVDLDISPVQIDWTSEDQSDPGVALQVDKEKMVKKNALNKTNLLQNKRRVYQSMESSKLWRMEVFRLITHHLQLSVKTRKAMYKANISVDSTHIQDLTQNLDYLMSNLQFTMEQISACPLILAHPHKNLYHVTQEVNNLLAQHFAWSGIGHTQLIQNTDLSDVNLASSFSSSEFVQTWQSSSSSLSPLSSPSTSFTSEGNLSSSHIAGKSSEPSGFSMSNNQNGMSHPMDYSYLLTDPIIHLNVLQYFLEKETGFSLLSTDSINFGK